MKPVITTANSRKAHSFMRSATAPETMDMAVATNTTWKKKSAASEYTESPSKPASAEALSTVSVRASALGAPSRAMLDRK